MTVLNEIPPHSIYRLRTKGNDVIGVPAIFNEIPVQKGVTGLTIVLVLHATVCLTLFSSTQCIISQLLVLVFMISGIIKVKVSGNTY